MKYMGGPHHLYIHWPFCKNKCHYCDFVALEGHSRFQAGHHKALMREVDSYFSNFAKPLSIDTLYMGGGTPSLYPLELMPQLFELLRSNCEFSSDAEMTIEVNPGGITQKHLSTWRSLGFNRMSIGVQVLDDEVLAKLNRHQKTKDVLKLIEMAPAFFNNISVDLIMGLPGVTPETWQRTLETAVLWPIKHISVYFLTVHDKTPLSFNVQKGRISLLSDDEMVDLYEHLGNFLAANGFLQYETSNYARSGHESRHNQAYWDRKPFKGFGLGASSFDGEYRYRNEKNLTRYNDYWLHGTQNPPARSGPKKEKIDSEKAYIERIMLGLRQKKGLALQDVVHFLPSSKLKSLQAKIELLQSRALLEKDGDTITLTRKGMALENEVVLHLI